MGTKVEREAGTATADKGVVVVDGPDGVALTMTPEAAEKMSDRLLQAASEASGQARIAEVQGVKLPPPE